MKHILLITACLALTLIMPNRAHCQAPDLKSTADFVLYTAFGPITNTGTSKITGKVGSNSIYSSGFGNVDGTMHGGDAATANAKADLTALYTKLSEAVQTNALASPIGGGNTLLAGVHKVNSATILDGNLILDAKGNSSAVFIFKFTGAFSTAAAASVDLVNGAQACNVFWLAEGKINVAAGSVMRGTFVSKDGAIDFSTGCTLEGRALTTTGAITVNKLFAYTPIGCGSKTLNGPVPPELGATGAYGLFSSNGAVTNLGGGSNVAGTIGTNVGATTGFDQANVSCTMHLIPDASTATAATDITTVYNYLNALPTDIELMAPAEFGNALVLTPHTYLMNSTTTFAGTVTLNARGNADAIFVIKVKGTFTTAAAASVVLSNGTQAKNVYWLIDGATDLNSNTKMSGTIVVNNGSLKIRTGTVIDGRALVRTGVVNTQAFTINNVSTGSWIEGSERRSFCKGDSVVLKANTGTAYQWSTGATTQSIVVRSIGSFSVTVDNNSGCTGVSPTVYANIDSIPNAAITVVGDTAFCQGSSVQLTAKPSGGSYLWSNGKTTETITVDTSGKYTVTVLSSKGCPGTSGFVNVTVYPFPIDTITANGPTTFCGPGTVTLLASPGKSYLWNTGAITQGIIVNKTGDFKVTVTGEGGCVTKSKNQIVLVHAPASATISTNGSTDICQGYPVDLIAADGATYLWSNGDTTKTIKAGTAGAYTVTITTSDGCKIVTNPINVTVKPVPHGLAITQTQDTLFSPYTGANTWYKVGNANSVGSGNRIVCNGSGEYYVNSTVANGCIAISDTLTVVCLTSGVDEEYFASTLAVYPNPTSGNLNISYTLPHQAVVSMNLYDVLGVKIAEILAPTVQSGSSKTSYDGSGLNAGVYFLETIANGNAVITKVVFGR
ncbi:MAG: DUF3494 domain-containing protein [Ignavibacteria bacterium]|nr:DUF3494 domain-containing protein [Ignavibacteria bacterium]